MDFNPNDRPGSASEWYDLGCLYRRNGDFGKAANAMREAVDMAESQFASGSISAEEYAVIKKKAAATVELLARITGFVNKDLMNP